MEQRAGTTGNGTAGNATAGNATAGTTTERTQRLLAGLNPAQAEAVTTDAAPLCILAGAGSGKTRVLTRRIAHRVAHGSADPRHVLALTFTRKAAGEMSGRLAALGVREGVAAGTFHAVAYAQLRRRWADRDERPPALLERKSRLIVPLLPRREAALQPADVASEIEWAKARLVPPEGYEEAAELSGRSGPLPPAAMAELFDTYEREKRRRGLIDLDDLVLLCGRLLHDDERFGTAQRWRFRHLFVDEFQDVNPAQHRLLEGWRGSGHDLCVVGDPNQAIYSWNGADAGYLTRFRQRFPGSAVVRLDDNYRSSPQVLAVADAVLGTGARDSRPLRANRPDGPVPRIAQHATDLEESHAVARALRSRHGSELAWSHFAVLARTNAQLVLFETALRAAQVPCRVRGAAGFLRRPEVRDALADLGRRSGAALATAVADLEEMSAEAVPAGAGAADERRRHLDDLVRLARDYAAFDAQGLQAPVAGFLAWLEATVGHDEPDHARDAVTLATFHAAKGLEWPIVFVVGLERGLVPIGHADSPAARLEERRLLYVAVTRARVELHCSWAERRTFGSRTLARTPSPFLAEIEAAVNALGAGGSGADWRRHLAEPRNRLEAARRSGRPRIEVGRNADPAVLTALRSWRSGAARASGVPAFVILHDTTLAAMAEARPGDRRALLEVPGMGAVKAERYGDELLALLAGAAG